METKKFPLNSLEIQTYLATKPVVIKPKPLDSTNGCSNLNYTLYANRLFTSSNIYLDSPIWHQPIIDMPSYQESRINNINGINRLILEDMRELSKY